MAGLFDAGAMMWCKIQGVDLGSLPREFLAELSQAAVDGMTKRAKELTGDETTGRVIEGE